MDRYEEALKKARMYHRNAKTAGNYADVTRYENIFPELCKSEDEKIKQQLLWLCDEWEHNPERRTIPADIGNIKQIRKYLEKQKEQNPEEKPINWTELTWKDIIELEGIINKVHYEFRNGIGQESFGKEVLEKFREYKGDEYLDEIEQKEIFDADKFFAGKDVNDFKKELFLVIRGARELKPTDEEIWHNIENQIAPWLVDILQEGVESAEPKFKVGDKVKLASEPKYPAREIVEIKDGAYYFDSAVHLPFAKQDEWELVEEKPSGWSEEDERILKGIIGKIDHDQTYGVSKVEMLSFLNSFRSRPKSSDNWKPSKEQLDSLRNTIALTKGSSCSKCLPELYEDLKKLM